MTAMASAASPGEIAEAPVAAAVLGSGEPDDLAQILNPAVALVHWWRSPVVDIPVAHLADLSALRWEGDPAEAEESIRAELATMPARTWHAPLARDAAMLARRFAAIARCEDVALRLEPVEGNACHRFHADYVPVRLLTTYAGPGTEWRAAHPDGAAVQRMQAGHVGLFKGRGAGPVGILHRSPPIAGSGERRLLLVVDACLPAADDAVAWARS